jgi:hypothetical protein
MRRRLFKTQSLLHTRILREQRNATDAMTPSVLLVSTATRRLGTARTPRALAKAGFDVALIAPKGSLHCTRDSCRASRCFSETAIVMEVLHTLIRTVDEVSRADADTVRRDGRAVCCSR